MNRFDARGCAVSGADAHALEAFEAALAACLDWRAGAEPALAEARREAPGFVMAHALKAWMLLCGRDRARVNAARPVLARAERFGANARERLHLEAIGDVLDDDFERAKARLGELLRLEPRDVLALHVAQSLDHLTGDVPAMGRRVAAVLPAWSSDLRGHAAVLAMHAFALQERGEYASAEGAAQAALALDPSSPRAHHAMAHVFEMTGRPEAGARWMGERAAVWGGDSTVATHGWWHLALFQLARKRPELALELYDERVRAARSGEIADLVDAAALLWRLRLSGCDVGGRFHELAAAWGEHIDDAYCSFNDLHAMLAFVGSCDGERTQRLERVLLRSHSLRTRYGSTTRLLGLPACRALVAYARGKAAQAIALLAGLPARAHGLGGSHAQRHVLHLPLLRALERARRSHRPSHVPIGALA
jgi:tetratricopeptide (TPR) repeat protein